MADVLNVADGTWRRYPEPWRLPGNVLAEGDEELNARGQPDAVPSQAFSQASVLTLDKDDGAAALVTLCTPKPGYRSPWVKGDYVSVRSFPFVLSPAAPGNLKEVRSLVREAAKWLRKCKDTDQWAKPWPDRAGQKRRMLDDIAHGKTWLLWDDSTVAGTITIDTEETLGAQGQPIWPEHKRHELALYVRRVVISRRYAGLGLGAALLDWASDVAKRDYGATLIRVEVWTTNAGLHAYYSGQRFTSCEGRDPAELDDYPSQALFEREVGQAGSDYAKLFTEAEAPYGRRPRRRIPGWRIRGWRIRVN